MIAETLQAKPSEIYFTSGGSESDNWAVKNLAASYKSKGKHLITSKVEHHAVLNSCEYLQKLGYEVTYLNVDESGRISLEELSGAMREDTTAVSVMFANNEVGTIEPVYQIGKLAREHQVVFHTDAVQAYGQIPVSVQYYQIDLLSASAHKFHGPKGVRSSISGKELNFHPTFTEAARSGENGQGRKMLPVLSEWGKRQSSPTGICAQESRGRSCCATI